MPCPICEKRKEGRFCPAKGEKICAVCCGTEREVSIGCPTDCAYLAAAHRYEDEHKRQIPVDTPFLEERIPQGTLHTHQPLMAALAFTIAKACMSHPSATDPDVIAALRALAESYKTLISGIYYEKLPDIPVQREIYTALTALLDDLKQKQAAAGTSDTLKSEDIFFVVIFLFRMGLLRGNSRPRSRRFIEFLRGQFPQAEELKREEPRIIVP
ncbi:MAG TPA: hypothetical protein VKT53_03395 [Candidatus Acidoferrum sp.]|nr:hypothetical protein [Candidatus Acidoferrum sp.]